MSPWWNAHSSAGLLSLIALAACDEKASVPPASSVAAEVRVIPDPIVLVAGERIQLSAEVDDSEGRPVGGAEIVFRSSDTSKVVVSPAGFVRSEGPIGPAQVVVSSGGKQTAVSVQIKAGKARTIRALGGDRQSATVDSLLPRPLVVRVLDDKDNPVSGSDVTFIPADGGAADPPEKPTDSKGEASARWQLGPVAGNQSLSASIKGTPAAAVSFSAEAEGGPPAKLIGRRESVGPAAGKGGERLDVSLSDAQGNAKTGVTINWRVESGDGKLSSETSTTDAAGVASVVLTAGKRSRRNRVAARVGDLVTRMDVSSK